MLGQPRPKRRCQEYVAGVPVDLLDDYDFPARTIIETDIVLTKASAEI